MKKLIYLAVILVGISASAAAVPDVNDKVLKAFKQTFAGASDVVWKEMKNTVQAHFKMSEVQVRAMYDNDGNLLETVRYYNDERKLPLNILAKLKKRYSAAHVFGVTEITRETDVNYHITLRDETHYYVVKADPYANIELVDKFQRADPE